jgi:hypothetical protein
MPVALKAGMLPEQASKGQPERVTLKRAAQPSFIGYFLVLSPPHWTADACRRRLRALGGGLATLGDLIRHVAHVGGESFEPAQINEATKIAELGAGL